MCAKNVIFGILLHIVIKVVNYLASIIVDSVITCDKIIEETKTVSTNFNSKKVTYKTKTFYILLVFLLIIIALLIAVSIYCYLIKYQAKENKALFSISRNK